MVLEINYISKGEIYISKGEKATVKLNVDLKNSNLGIGDFPILKKNWRKIKSISSVHLVCTENKDNYSLLDNQIIDEILIFLTSIYRTFSLVIAQNNYGKNGKNVTIHYLYGSYNYTEITVGNRTFSSYLPIKESIEFAKKVLSNMIV